MSRKSGGVLCGEIWSDGGSVIYRAVFCQLRMEVNALL